MRNWAPPGQQPTLSNYQATAANNWDWWAYWYPIYHLFTTNSW
jgi:hypothetical protein